MKKQVAATTSRQRAYKAAIGSVRAEGLKPSIKTQTYLKHYSNGQISAAKLHKAVLGEAKRIVARSAS